MMEGTSCFQMIMKLAGQAQALFKVMLSLIKAGQAHTKPALPDQKLGQ
jgi:hypothetical protein